MPHQVKAKWVGFHPCGLGPNQNADNQTSFPDGGRRSDSLRPRPFREEVSLCYIYPDPEVGLMRASVTGAFPSRPIAYSRRGVEQFQPRDRGLSRLDDQDPDAHLRRRASPMSVPLPKTKPGLPSCEFQITRSVSVFHAASAPGALAHLPSRPPRWPF